MNKTFDQTILFLSIFCYEVLGVFLCSIVFLVTLTPLSILMKYVLIFISKLIALVLLTKYFYDSYPSDNTLSIFLYILSKEMSIVFLVFVYRIGINIFSELIKNQQISIYFFWIILVIYTILVLFFLAFFVQSLITKISFRFFIKQPIQIIRLMFIILISTIILNVFAIILNKLILNSVVSMLFKHLLIAFVENILVLKIINMKYKNIESEAIKNNKYIIIGLLIIFCVLLYLKIDVIINSYSIDKKINLIIDESINNGNLYLESKNIELALLNYNIAQNRYCAFDSLINENSQYQLKEIYENNIQDPVIGALYLSEINNINEFENKIRNLDLNLDWYPILLHCYNNVDVLSDEQIQFQKELVLQCISKEQFSCDYIFKDDIIGNEKKLFNEIKGYEESFDTFKSLNFLKNYINDGNINEEDVLSILTLAEKNKKNIYLQYVAFNIGANYKKDNATHYERTIEAAKRFDSLYASNNKEKEILANEKLEVGVAILNCYDYETALDFLKESYNLDKNVQTAILCAKTYQKLDDFNSCLELVNTVLQDNKNNHTALYLKAICHLKNEEIDEAIDAAGELSNILLNNKYDEDIETELYVCCEYFALDDDVNYTDFTYQIYDDLTENQKEKMKKYKLLWEYVNSIHMCFMDKNFKSAKSSIDNIMIMNDSLIYSHYLKGTIAFNENDYENALKEFKIAESKGSNTPALLFSIANTYDVLEDYNNAYTYAKRVEEILPNQDHENDIYGISYHNKKLLEALKPYVREE